jgi:hypothetical protein
MAEPMSLPLFSEPERPSPTDVDRLVQCLNGRGWLRAKQLLASHGFNDRELRALANASEGRIVSGQKGYALIESVTVEEANHAAAWIERQARQMAKRATEIRRAMQRRWGSAA